MLTEKEIIDLKIEAVEIRLKVLKMIINAHASHIASAYSCTDILVYLYNKVLNVNLHNIKSPDRDKFILSKGWAVSALYAVLEKHGFLARNDLNLYCKDGSKFIGCATRNGICGIDATTGSMGHGMPIGVGYAIAGKLKPKKERVVVLIGDGELNEGSTWEAILQAGQYKLDNLTLIIDCNGWQSFGKTKDILDPEPLSAKLESFRWSVKLTDGHDFRNLDHALSILPFEHSKPNAVIANTVKGKGVSVFENLNEWHYKTPTANEIKIALKELHI